MIICINQLIRPTGDWALIDGWGDCKICQTSPDNANCKGYLPIKEQEDAKRVLCLQRQKNTGP